MVTSPVPQGNREVKSTQMYISVINLKFLHINREGFERSMHRCMQQDLMSSAGEMFHLLTVILTAIVNPKEKQILFL